LPPPRVFHLKAGSRISDTGKDSDNPNTADNGWPLKAAKRFFNAAIDGGLPCTKRSIEACRPGKIASSFAFA
jgi:hypothetical protein